MIRLKRWRGKRVVFCMLVGVSLYIPKKLFVQLCLDMVQNQMSIQISQDYSSMVNFARCKCLGANVLRGPDQFPWDGKLPYDYQLWIDSDIVFNTESSGNCLTWLSQRKQLPQNPSMKMSRMRREK